MLYTDPIASTRVRARDSGAGLAAQRQAILAEAERRGWEIVEILEDAGYSGRDLRRPAVRLAMDVLRNGGADTLVVAKLDRISRSMLDFASIMATAQKQGWGMIALDCQVDTTTPAGEAMAHVLATFAHFERRVISQRTKEALAAKRAQGVRLGRPRQLPRTVVRRIVRDRRQGVTLSEIARRLNEDRVATAQGGAQWWPSTVRSVLRSVEHDD